MDSQYAAHGCGIRRYAPHRSHLTLVREARPEYGEDPGPDDAPDEDDRLDDLAHEICSLAAHIHAATQRLLELIAEFDRLRGWERGGHRSCAHWLAYRTGIRLNAAREKVRAGRALVDLPETRASMARGELSFSKVRALTRVATPDNESDLLELARGCTTVQTERVVRAWKRGSAEDEAALERQLHEERSFSVVPDDEGMYVVRGKLPAEVGALLMRAVEAASDALYTEEREKLPARVREATTSAEESARRAAQRRADALGLLAERAMAAGFGGSRASGARRGDDEDGAPDAASDAATASGDDIPISGTRAERYQVVLHVTAETLSAGGEAEVSHLEDGTRVTAVTSRRLSCDAATVRMTHDPEGNILDVGRRTRTIPPALRRALDARDKGCRFPGCGLRFTDAHHVKHWADGGETSLDNCLLLCRHHHRLVHEGGWRVVWAGPGQAQFIDPRGGTHYDGRWQAPELPVDVVGALVAQNRERGTDPDGFTASAEWKREQDIPDDVYFRALGATA